MQNNYITKIVFGYCDSKRQIPHLYMLSGVKRPSITARMCLRFLFLSSDSMSTFPRPIFLPISPASGIKALGITGVTARAGVDFRCSLRLGLWPTNI